MGSEAPMFHFQRALCKPFSKLSFESLLMRAAFIMATLSTLCKCCGIAGFSMCLPALKGLLWPASADCSHLTYSIEAWSSQCQDSWGAGTGQEKCLVGAVRLLAEWCAKSLLWKWVRVEFQAVFSSLALQALSFSPTLLFQTVLTSNNAFWHPSSSLSDTLHLREVEYAPLEITPHLLGPQELYRICPMAGGELATDSPHSFHWEVGLCSLSLQSGL